MNGSTLQSYANIVLEVKYGDLINLVIELYHNRCCTSTKHNNVHASQNTYQVDRNPFMGSLWLYGYDPWINCA